MSDPKPFFDFADTHWSDMRTVSLAVDWKHRTVIMLKQDGVYGAGVSYYGIYYGVPGHVAAYSTSMTYEGALAQAEWSYQNALRFGAKPYEATREFALSQENATHVLDRLCNVPLDNTDGVDDWELRQQLRSFVTPDART